MSRREATARSLRRHLVPASSAVVLATALLAGCTTSPATPASAPGTGASGASAAASVSASSPAVTPAASATSATPTASATSAPPPASASAAASGSTPASAPVAPPASTPAAAARTTSTVAATISNFTFGPASGSAPLVVRWTNNDAVDHDVTGSDGTTTGIIRPGASAELRFDRPTTFAYICGIHPFMTGSVTIR